MCEPIAHRGPAGPGTGPWPGSGPTHEAQRSPEEGGDWLTETPAARTPQVPPGFDAAALPASLRLLWAANPGEGEAGAAGTSPSTLLLLSVLL